MKCDRIVAELFTPWLRFLTSCLDSIGLCCRTLRGSKTLIRLLDDLAKRRNHIQETQFRLSLRFCMSMKPRNRLPRYNHRKRGPHLDND